MKRKPFKMSEQQETTDIINRKVVVGDLVVSNNLIYEVQSIAQGGDLRIILHQKSKTTKTVYRTPWEVCLLPKDDVVLWLLKK